MKKFKLAIVALCLSSLCMFCCNMYAADYDSNSKVHFKNIILPDACENTTFISTPKGGKTTSRSYGKVKISSYSHCDSVDFWLRSKYDGNWHYWLHM